MSASSPCRLGAPGRVDDRVSADHERGILHEAAIGVRLGRRQDFDLNPGRLQRRAVCRVLLPRQRQRSILAPVLLMAEAKLSPGGRTRRAVSKRDLPHGAGDGPCQLGQLGRGQMDAVERIGDDVAARVQERAAVQLAATGW